MSNAPAFTEKDWGVFPKMPRARDFWPEHSESKTSSSYHVPDLEHGIDDEYYAFVTIDTPVDELREQYEFRNRPVVKDYLESNPALFEMLRVARDKIAEYFGPETCAVLDVIKDNEVDDDERLFVFIQTTLGADEALDLLDELYERWWLDALAEIQPKLSMDVEFI